MSKRKYRILFSPKRRYRPGPKGPDKDLIDAVVAMKRHSIVRTSTYVADPLESHLYISMTTAWEACHFLGKEHCAAQFVRSDSKRARRPSHLPWAQGVGRSNRPAPTICNGLATEHLGAGSEPYQNRSGTDDRIKIDRP